MKARTLASSGDPQKILSAAEMYRMLMAVKYDGTDECKFWKGQASKALGDLYVAGVSGPDTEEDGRFVTESYLDPDLLKALRYYRIAVRYGCYDGVVLIGDIYTALGDYDHAARIYAGVVRRGYAGKEDAEHILGMWMSEGRIDCIPDEEADSESKLNGFDDYFPTLESSVSRSKIFS